MKNLFNYENGVMSAISSIADSLILGILWVFCSLPVFTVGASSAAFYYAYNKCIRQKTDYIWRTFFDGFKRNFKQATQIWLIVLCLMFIIIIDFHLLRFMENTAVLALIIQIILITVVLFIIIWALYLFPYISRFEGSNKTVMKNCALIAVVNIPQSLLLLIVFAITALIFLCLPMLNLLFPSLYMFCANRLLEKIFRKYMPPEDLDGQTAEPPTEEA